jgi:hypothetical protein
MKFQKNAFKLVFDVRRLRRRRCVGQDSIDLVPDRRNFERGTRLFQIEGFGAESDQLGAFDD